MSFMIWTQEQFGTNVSLHDHEHQTIFRLVSALHESAGQADRAALGKQLDGLISYVAEHFGSEERNMEKCAYSDYLQHKQAHDDLVAICVDLQKKFHAGQAEITHEVTGFIKDWLVNHIPHVDRRYGPALNSAGIA